jgi:hypothetical protein
VRVACSGFGLDRDAFACDRRDDDSIVSCSPLVGYVEVVRAHSLATGVESLFQIGSMSKMILGLGPSFAVPPEFLSKVKPKG